MIPREWIAEAQERLAPHIVKTQLTHDAKRGIYLKWENQQVTGSFKPRGALNKVLSLEDWERRAGLVAASAGNHGQGVALAGRLTQSKVEVFVPAHAVPSKVDAMRKLGAVVRSVAGGYSEAEAAGRRYAHEHNKTFVSPYNDGQVVAGQATVATETLQQLSATGDVPAAPTHRDPSEAGVWVVPVGGGGLIAGCGAVLSDLSTRPSLIGVQAAASPFTHSLLHRGTQQGLRDNPTLADGLSGAIEEDSITVPMMREMLSDLLLVSEEAIGRAMAFAWYAYGEKIEGSAAAALAAVLDGTIVMRPCVVIISGGNVAAEIFQKTISQHAGQRWD